MIGNAFPYKDTGYSILEQGDLDQATFQLKVNSYLATDRNGDTLAECSTLEEAENFLADLLEENSSSK